jgi:hypothetical protein
MSTKPLRTSMPQVAAFIDGLRAAFGADEVDAMMARGLAGEPVFHAEEAGHAVGTPAPAQWSSWHGQGLDDRHYCAGSSGECVGTERRCIRRFIHGRAAPHRCGEGNGLLPNAHTRFTSMRILSVDSYRSVAMPTLATRLTLCC